MTGRRERALPSQRPPNERTHCSEARPDRAHRQREGGDEVKTKYKAALLYLDVHTNKPEECAGFAVWQEKSLHVNNRGIPVNVLPATPEAYDAQVEAMAKAMYLQTTDFPYGPARWKLCVKLQSPMLFFWRAKAVGPLAAIGIKRPKRTAKEGTKREN